MRSFAANLFESAERCSLRHPRVASWADDGASFKIHDFTNYRLLEFQCQNHVPEFDDFCIEATHYGFRIHSECYDTPQDLVVSHPSFHRHHPALLKQIGRFTAQDLKNTHKVAPFPAATYCIIEDCNAESPHIAYWTNGNKAFVIKETDQLAENYFKGHFSHNKPTSFQRQLNLYGFKTRKGVGGELEVNHEHFIRGRFDLLRKIQKTRKPPRKVEQSPNPLYSQHCPQGQFQGSKPVPEQQQPIENDLQKILNESFTDLRDEIGALKSKVGRLVDVKAKFSSFEKRILEGQIHNVPPTLPGEGGAPSFSIGAGGNGLVRGFAPLPLDLNGDGMPPSLCSSVSSRGDVNFLQVTFDLVNHCSTTFPTVASWTDDSDAFIVHDKRAFAQSRGCPFERFEDNLKSHGFLTIHLGSSVIFRHPLFQRGRPSLLNGIRKGPQDDKRASQNMDRVSVSRLPSSFVQTQACDANTEHLRTNEAIELGVYNDKFGQFASIFDDEEKEDGEKKAYKGADLDFELFGEAEAVTDFYGETKIQPF